MHSHTPQVSTSAQAPLLLSAWAKSRYVPKWGELFGKTHSNLMYNMYKGVTLCDFLQLYLYIKIKV